MPTALSIKRAGEIVRQFRDRNIVVLGDVMLDEFIWGDVSRISPEAPVPVVEIKRESTHLGGAANVMANLLALGAQACVIGVVGEDAAAEKLRASLRSEGGGRTKDLLVIDESRPTTIKTRIIAHNQLVVRADRERRTPVDVWTEDRIIAVLEEVIVNADALLVSDYDKGVITARILGKILPLAYEH